MRCPAALQADSGPSPGLRALGPSDPDSAVPWRDPHSVSPAELKEYIGFLEKACEEHPRSADLRTCLGMAYAMNYDVYKSMDALEAAVDWMKHTSSRK